MEPGIPYTKNDSVKAHWKPYAYRRYKFNNAVEKGARGLWHIRTIANPNTSFTENFIYAHICEKGAVQIFSDAGKDHNEVKKQLAGFQSPSFAFNKQQTVAI